ncbi:MAG: hypothetical protein ABI554_03215 [Flavobacterium sp.]
MKNYSKITLSVLFVATAAFTSCSKDDDPTPMADTSLYGRLGGTKLVADPDNAGQMIEAGRLSYRKVVTSTIGLIVADVKSNAPGNLATYFAPVLAETGDTQATSLAKLNDNLTDFFSFNTGGTNAVNNYSGLNMVAAHNPATNPRMGAKADSGDFDKFEGYVGSAAVMNGVKADSQEYKDVVAVLESLRAPIVQDK